VDNTRRNSRTICEPLSSTELTTNRILTQSSPQFLYYKLHTSIREFTVRIPEGTKSILTGCSVLVCPSNHMPPSNLPPVTQALFLPATSGLLPRLVTLRASNFLHADQHILRTSDYLSLCFSAVSTATANRTASSKRTRHLKLDLLSHYYPAPMDIHG